MELLVDPGWNISRGAFGAIETAKMVAQPDLSRCGGFTQARDIAWIARENFAAVCPHAWLTALLTAASLHFNAPLLRSLFLEYNVSTSPMLRDVSANPIKLNRDGAMDVPQSPGLGIESNEKMVEKYRVVWAARGGLSQLTPPKATRRLHQAMGATATQTRKPSRATNLIDILSPVGEQLTEVERRLLRQVDAFDPGVRDYVDYTLDGQGKRLRPSLALFSAAACGSDGEDGVLTLGVIVELIHVATLVHDDINDGALMRRSKPTANSKWGNEISVLLGDCLFARALQLAASYPTTEVCRRVAEATNIVCSGEILQTQNRFNFNLSIKEYLKFIEMKTAELFAVSCELGAYLAGADERVKNALREYGLNLGIAYQIYDDCVDIFGQEPKAGKSLGSDLAKGKLTLPILRVIQHATVAERERVNTLILHNGQGDHGEDWERLFVRHRAVPYTLDVTTGYIEKAMEALTVVPSTDARERLASLARFVSNQTRAIAP